MACHLFEPAASSSTLLPDLTFPTRLLPTVVLRTLGPSVHVQVTPGPPSPTCYCTASQGLECVQQSDHFRKPIEAKVKGPCTKEPRSGEHGLKGNKTRGFQASWRWARAPCVHANLANTASRGQTSHLLCLGQSLGSGPPADLAVPLWSCGRTQGHGGPYPTCTRGSHASRDPVTAHVPQGQASSTTPALTGKRQASCTHARAACGAPVPYGSVQALSLSAPLQTVNDLCRNSEPGQPARGHHASSVCQSQPQGFVLSSLT